MINQFARIQESVVTKFTLILCFGGKVTASRSAILRENLGIPRTPHSVFVQISLLYEAVFTVLTFESALFIMPFFNVHRDIVWKEASERASRFSACKFSLFMTSLYVISQVLLAA